MDEQTLLTIFLGFFLIIFIATTIKIVRSYYVYKASFYPEIYSSLFEFMVRQGNLKRMSHSYWLENELGAHRIMFQVTKTSQKDQLQPYIIILLSTGLYIIQVHNVSMHYIYHKGHFKSVDEKLNIHLLPNPISEISTFQKHFLSLIEQHIPTYSLIVFPNDSQLDSDEKKIRFLMKKQLFQTLKAEHIQQIPKLSAVDIENIYQCFMRKCNSIK